MRTFTIPGPPEPLERARHAGHVTYDTPRNRANKRKIAVAYRKQHPGPIAYPAGQPVRLHAVFAFQRPKSHYVARDPSRPLRADAPAHHLGKPDTSNLLKLLEDSLTGVAWHDDAQVNRLTAVKVWSPAEPFSRISIDGVST